MREIYKMSAESLPSIHFVDDAAIVSPFVHRKRKALEYIMYIIKAGEMYLAEDDIPITLREGDICILDKDRTHVGIRASVCDYTYIHFMHKDLRLLKERDEEKVRELLLSYRRSSLGSDIFSYDKCEGNIIYLPKLWHAGNMAVRLRIEELAQKARQETYNPLENHKVMCGCYIQQLFMEISRGFLNEEKEVAGVSRPGYQDKIGRVAEWLNRNFDSEITGTVLEEAFEYNFDYMNRTFKKVMGQTIFQYLTHIRIDHAKMLILNTSMKMSEVGRRVGFPDEYYFSRVFKKAVGVSPVAYAGNCRQSERWNHS